MAAADAPVVRDALRAWLRGDLDAFERALTEDAELLWYEPSPWDCHGRVQIMRLLRQRRAEDRPFIEVRIDDVDADTLVVSVARPDQGQGAEEVARATRVTLRDGKISRLRQFRTLDQALAATA
nr:nuclear transport factor 2 family protein [Streptomyces sp. 846.5]